MLSFYSLCPPTCYNQEAGGALLQPLHYSQRFSLPLHSLAGLSKKQFWLCNKKQGERILTNQTSASFVQPGSKTNCSPPQAQAKPLENQHAGGSSTAWDAGNKQMSLKKAKWRRNF